MNIFDAIRFVGTPFALIAFIIGAATSIYVQKLRSDERKLTSASRDTLATMMETYSIRDDNLTPDMKFQLMRDVLQGRSTRFRYVAFLSALFGVILACLTGWAFYIFSHTPAIVSPSNQPNTTTAIPTTPIPLGSPAEGTWDISVSCPEGSQVNEPRAQFTNGRYSRVFEVSKGLKGKTELALGLTAENSINVTGYVLFNDSDLYSLDAKAQLVNDGSFSGIGKFGSSANCALTAKRL